MFELLFLIYHSNKMIISYVIVDYHSYYHHYCQSDIYVFKNNFKNFQVLPSVGRFTSLVDKANTIIIQREHIIIIVFCVYCYYFLKFLTSDIQNTNFFFLFK